MGEQTPQDRGREFEAAFARVFGVEPNIGSGNLWFLKLDVGDGVILWSCKHTDAESLRVSKDMMREVQRAINGPGGVGGNTIPGIATRVGGEVFVTLMGDDFMRLIEEETRYLRPSKGEQKRRRARKPALLREEDE